MYGNVRIKVVSDRHNTPLPDIALWGTAPKAPKLIAGRYKVEGQLGQGGMGRVYRCHDSVLQRSVAVKLVHHDLEEQYFARFHQEAKAASQLNHRNILHVLDFGLTEERQPYMVMELVAGETIDEILRRSGPFSIAETLEIMVNVCLGMQHAHSQGVVHRDLKTSNIMIGRRGDQEMIPLILDFGIAKMINNPDDKGMLTKTGEIMGSPRYMSPEQASGLVVDGRSDIYSLGCVLFEMLTGRPPFDADSAMETIYMHLNDRPPKLNERSKKQFSEQLEAITRRLLQKNPADRFASMTELSEELIRAQHSLDDSKLDTTGSTSTSQTSKSSSPIVVLSIAIAAIIPIAGAALLLYVFEPSPSPIKSSFDPSNVIFDSTPEHSFDEGKQTVLKKANLPTFNGYGIADMAELKGAISKRDKINTLSLSEGRMDNEMMNYLLSHSEINNLTFFNVVVSRDAQLALFKSPHIKSLIWNGPLFRPSLANLDKMSALSVLRVEKADLGDEDIPNIMRAQQVTDLALNLNKRLTGKALRNLSRLKVLQDLDVADTDLTNAELALLACMPKLARLDVSNNSEINAAGVLDFWRQRKNKTRLRLYAVSCRSLPESVQQDIHKVLPMLDIRSSHRKSDLLSEKALGGMLNYDGDLHLDK